MNWVTTNIRLTEDQYMELKMQAARERKSVAAVIREKIAKNKSAKKKKDTKAFFKELDRLAKRTAEENKGINLTKAVIEMRYEQ